MKTSVHRRIPSSLTGLQKIWRMGKMFSLQTEQGQQGYDRKDLQLELQLKVHLQSDDSGALKSNAIFTFQFIFEGEKRINK